MDFHIPKWAEVLQLESDVKTALIAMAKSVMDQIHVIRDVYQLEIPEDTYIEKVKLDNISLDTGNVQLLVQVDHAFYYEMLSDMLGMY